MKKSSFLFIGSTALVICVVAFTNCTPSMTPVSSSSSALSRIGPEASGCRPGPGASGSPKTIQDAVKLVNSLPKPVTLECFMESLDRPLDLFAGTSTFSAQPSVGMRSPRIFVFKGRLIMSVVPEGLGSNLLEFGEMTSDEMAIKGEIKFPVAGELPIAEPYTHIRDGSGASCRVCHQGESREPSVTFTEAFVSRIMRPDPFNEVSVEFMNTMTATCDATKEPARCAFLKALFGKGSMRRSDFPEKMPSL